MSSCLVVGRDITIIQKIAALRNLESFQESTRDLLFNKFLGPSPLLYEKKDISVTN